jgi:hypothetical protein
VSRVLWYDPPGCALTDEELDLLRRIAAANAPVMFQAEGRTVPAHLAFDHRVDVLRDLRKAGWSVLEVWVPEPGNRGYAPRRYSAAQAYCTSPAARRSSSSAVSTVAHVVPFARLALLTSPVPTPNSCLPSSAHQ